MLRDILRRYVRLSKTENKILDIIQTEKSGNAYGLWKASGLKHYPTVLRTLKKLEEKRLVQALSEKGRRGERIYIPTLAGILVSYVFKGEEKKIVDIVAQNSGLFRELSEIEKIDYFAFRAVRDILLDMYREMKEPRSIDETVKNVLTWGVIDCLSNPLDEYSYNPEWIIKFSKVKWIRQVVIDQIEWEINWAKKEIEKWKKLKETLLTEEE